MCVCTCTGTEMKALCACTWANGSLHSGMSTGTHLDDKTAASYKVSQRWTAHE